MPERIRCNIKYQMHISIKQLRAASRRFQLFSVICNSNFSNVNAQEVFQLMQFYFFIVRFNLTSLLNSNIFFSLVYYIFIESRI